MRETERTSHYMQPAMVAKALDALGLSRCEAEYVHEVMAGAEYAANWSEDHPDMPIAFMKMLAGLAGTELEEKSGYLVVVPKKWDATSQVFAYDPDGKQFILGLKWGSF